jgi:hypothetical protein
VPATDVLPAAAVLLALAIVGVLGAVVVVVWLALAVLPALLTIPAGQSRACSNKDVLYVWGHNIITIIPMLGVQEASACCKQSSSVHLCTETPASPVSTKSCTKDARRTASRTYQQQPAGLLPQLSLLGQLQPLPQPGPPGQLLSLGWTQDWPFLHGVTRAKCRAD